MAVASHFVLLDTGWKGMLNGGAAMQAPWWTFPVSLWKSAQTLKFVLVTRLTRCGLWSHKSQVRRSTSNRRDCCGCCSPWEIPHQRWLLHPLKSLCRIVSGNYSTIRYLFHFCISIGFLLIPNGFEHSDQVREWERFLATKDGIGLRGLLPVAWTAQGRMALKWLCLRSAFRCHGAAKVQIVSQYFLEVCLLDTCSCLAWWSCFAGWPFFSPLFVRGDWVPASLISICSSFFIP